MYREDRRNMPPIRIGDEMDVTIESVGEKGDGLAKVKGFVIFVPNTKKGDNVKVRITKVFRKVGFAEVIGEGEAKEIGEEAEGSEETEYSEDEQSEEAAEEE